MKECTQNEIERFFARYPQTAYLRAGVERVVERLSEIRLPNKVLLCGNGGSFADCGHIAGELMKRFKLPRTVSGAGLAAHLAERLEGAIPAVVLGESSPLSTAVANDIGGDFVYAQQAYGLTYGGDVFIGISTSGNARNVLYAMQVARNRGAFTVALTGENGGALRGACNELLNVPAAETYAVQELHLPLYHMLCAAAEAERWGDICK